MAAICTPPTRQRAVLIIKLGAGAECGFIPSVIVIIEPPEAGAETGYKLDTINSGKEKKLSGLALAIEPSTSRVTNMSELLDTSSGAAGEKQRSELAESRVACM